ncbi:carbamoyl phosphate synthase small subunit [Gemmiger sp.]|uniref:carbamoyl phosphate synthase small subunit n=1 Tax=Gemmiger sp. TaxID=2049027 RepID=UPI002A748601|nr:carbamoyl phosphate synthase small subunit [Gemmiger sp.]MDY2695398.1 carbamoyl phosphate synthase small subunit [Gemmiger sp.]
MQSYLILANGQVFRGQSIGCPGTTIGEVVFATGMVGFEETLTDPSYYGQIITQTYPLIGNYGMNSEDVESGKIWAKGYIVREACKTPSNFRSEETLDAFLKKNGIIGIEGVDTRSLTRTLRESGVMNGAITTEFDPDAEPEKKAALMPAITAYAVTEAVATVTCAASKTFEPTTNVIDGREVETPLHVALLDLGCKNNIVRCLQKRGCRVTVLPGTATAAELAALNPDGLMLSNGPGDPAENVGIIANIKQMLDTGIPTFGICLGHQLTALAAGAKTCKLKYGHRGANQPVTSPAKQRTFITSQNHGYAVMADTLPETVGKMSYFNANDGTCEGMDYFKWNCFTVQFHPEANGGPKDTEFLFDEFVKRMLAAKGVINDA